MTRTLRSLFLFVTILLSGSAMAQEIGGRVLDEKNEPMISAVVQVYTGGILKGGTITDIDGEYTIKPLDPGYYDVLVIYTNYDSIFTNKVVVSPGQRTPMNFKMTRHVKGLDVVIITDYKVPLVKAGGGGSVTIDKTHIDHMPTNQVTDIVSTTKGVYQSKKGSDVSIGGARTTGTLYIIDGVQVQGTTGIDMAQSSIDQIEVISSGIPANYGDVSGGVVNITSRGVSQKLTGSVRLQHSIDGYNNNLGSFSIAGPLYKKTMHDGDRIFKKPVLGFALSGDVYSDHDRYPTFNEQYVTKGDVLKKLQDNPLKIAVDNNGLPTVNLASNYITQKDLTTTRIPPHNTIQEVRLNGKLDYQLTDNMHIVTGGTFDYLKQDVYNRSRNLFAPEATPVQNTISGRAYLRFTQKFGKAGDTSSRHNIISNAYYSVQADYQKLYQNEQDPTFKDNIFNYGYVGKFNETRSQVYQPIQQDSLTKKSATILMFNPISTITYDRSELNPKLSNYNTQLFNQYINPYNVPLFSLNQIQAYNGLLNGDEPKYTYDLFYSPGATQSFYTKFNSDQYALDVNASFDLLAGKTKHAIQFGLYYQQRIEKSYTMYSNPNGTGTNSLWNLMRNLVSSIDNGNLKYDKAHPNFIVNGKPYTYADIVAGKVLPGPNDTIFYNYTNVSTDKYFDNNLRTKLGAAYTANGGTKDINIDALAPSTFSLNMFSADELLNQGRPFVGYQGYTYTGATPTGSVNFNDFWSQKDKNGNYTRPIAAFSPNYIAGYLLDNFNYKDVHFNIGVRIDRYSANTKVLIDPYSEYGEKNVSQVPGTNNVINGGKHPGNIPGNYVVYVDDNTAPNGSIIGYRSGDSWYDPTGKFVSDPATLKQFSGGRDPQPSLVNDSIKITSNNFNPNLSFTDYTPQVLVQPRVSFSFPISDVADFYAHYDIYSHRPTGQVDATAYDYYYLQQNGNNYINNANLKPEKTYDYEVGFQEKLSEHSALTITAFYKERKDMITAVPYLFAWPITYYTYGNRDFSTAKGMTLYYDLRATSHLSMNVSYTLQFVEGTGSTPSSRNGLLTHFIEAGLPNLRYITALDNDSRHNIAANLDYRYKTGEGPIVSGKHIFQNAGVDFIARGRSGEPYTRFTDALQQTVIGGINGSRLPWHFGIDLRADKDFSLTRGTKNSNAVAGVKPKRPLFLKAILQVNNLLQTRDILGVYGYTGRPDDNGYLTSPFGKQFAPQQINQQSYIDLYKIAYNDPGHFNYARTISFALEFNF
jgi:hypothetical protein